MQGQVLILSDSVSLMPPMPLASECALGLPLCATSLSTVTAMASNVATCFAGVGGCVVAFLVDLRRDAVLVSSLTRVALRCAAVAILGGIVLFAECCFL